MADVITSKQEIQTRPANLSGKSNARPSMTQVVSAIKSTSSQLSIANCTTRDQRRVISSSQPTTSIFSNVNSTSQATSTCMKNSGLLGLNEHSSVVHSSSQNKGTPRMITIFKSKLLQISQKNSTFDRKKKQSNSQHVLSISGKENTVPKAAVRKSFFSQACASDFTPSGSVKRKNCEIMLPAQGTISPAKAARATFSQRNRATTQVHSYSFTNGETYLRNIIGGGDLKMEAFLSTASQQAFSTTANNKGVPRKANINFHSQGKKCASNPHAMHVSETNSLAKSMCHSQKLDSATQGQAPRDHNKLQKEEKMKTTNLAPSAKDCAQQQAFKHKRVFYTLEPGTFKPHNVQEVYEVKHNESKTKRAIPNVDVEQHAKNKQLSKLNSATLQLWLKHRGISVKARDKKEELVCKIMKFLNET